MTDERYLTVEEETERTDELHALEAKAQEWIDMTYTPAWQKLYGWMTQQIDLHGRQVLDAEKTRDVVHHQEGVKIIRDVIERVQWDMDRLRHHVVELRNIPLLADEAKRTVKFDEATGVIHWVDLPRPLRSTPAEDSETVTDEAAVEAEE